MRDREVRARKQAAREGKELPNRAPAFSGATSDHTPVVCRNKHMRCLSCHPKASSAHGGRQQPAEESISSHVGRARRVDVVMHDAAVNGPATAPADAIEGDANSRGGARSALAQRVPTPRLAGWGRDAKAQQNQLEPPINLRRGETHTRAEAQPLRRQRVVRVTNTSRAAKGLPFSTQARSSF